MNKEPIEILIKVENRTESSLPFIDNEANGYWVEKRNMVVFTEKEWEWEMLRKNIDQKIIEEKDKEIERLKKLIKNIWWDGVTICDKHNKQFEQFQKENNL